MDSKLDSSLNFGSDTETQSSMGIGCSDGIGIGEAILVRSGRCPLPALGLLTNGAEKTRSKESFKKAKSEVFSLFSAWIKDSKKESPKTQSPETQCEIFEAHQMMLEDPEWIESIEASIDSGIPAPHAVDQVSSAFAEAMKSAGTEYLRARAADILDVADRVIRQILGEPRADLSLLPENSIIVAEDLEPSETALLNPKSVSGIILEKGGRTSHTAILAQTLGIPCVVGVSGVLTDVQAGATIVLDGATGAVAWNLGVRDLSVWSERKIQQSRLKKSREIFVSQKSLTQDGKGLEIAANIASPKDIAAALENGAEGIGLFRSEFLFMDRPSAPTEQEQVQAYQEVLRAFTNKKVVIRTFDIGGDKPVPYLGLPPEQNPFLGYRAVRFCLDESTLFRTQIRALLSAAKGSNAKLCILVPFVSTLEEWRKVVEHVESIAVDLGITRESFELGLMIEIPSAALNADAFAKECDFFSVGTNDLIQYTMAVDRLNPKVAQYYQAAHPSVLRLIELSALAAKNHGKWIGICGESAAQENLLPLWVGMGIDELSMGAGAILKLRERLSKLNSQECETLWKKAKTLSTQAQVLDLCNGMTQ